MQCGINAKNHLHKLHYHYFSFVDFTIEVKESIAVLKFKNTFDVLTMLWFEKDLAPQCYAIFTLQTLTLTVNGLLITADELRVEI